MGVRLERHGPLALVTGAAQGIGAALARALHQRGFRLVLVDQQGERLTGLARTLGGVETVVMDLAAPSAVNDLAAALEGRDLGLVVHNAATSPFGPLVETDPARLEATLAVNTRVPLLLTRALGPQLLARGRGGLVFMSSLIAMHGAPGFAAYAATRGFTLALGESLWAELRGSGLDVLVACPGAVDTEGFRDLRPNRGALRWTPVASPTAVAEEILEALGGGGPTRVVGLSSRLAERAFSLLPRGAASRLVASRVRRLYRR